MFPANQVFFIVVCFVWWDLMADEAAIMVIVLASALFLHVGKLGPWLTFLVDKILSQLAPV